MSRFWSSPVSSRGSGYRAMCAARCRPPASLVKVVLARVGRPSRAAVPVAGAKADAGLEWLPMASRQGSAAAVAGRSTAALQAALDAAEGTAKEPGLLVVPPGLYTVTDSLTLRSHETVFLEAGAVVRTTSDRSLVPRTHDDTSICATLVPMDRCT